MRLQNIKEFKNKKVLVVGLGVSGRSVIEKIAGYTKSIIAVDSNPYLNIKDEFNYLKKIKDFNFEVVIDENINKKRKILKDVDFIIVSPGVPNDIYLLKKADSLGIPVFSEMELGWRLLSKKEKENTIAVTGTNGKTTVVTLITKILNDANLNAISCGNIGNPLISTIKNGSTIKNVNTNEDVSTIENVVKFEDINKYDSNLIRVMEVSSFQLERIYSFNPKVGIILNITSDHLDRHYSMENYAKIKFNLFKNANKKNWAILNLDDEYINKIIEEKNYFDKCPFNLIGFSLDFSNQKACLKFKDSEVFYNFAHNNFVYNYRNNYNAYSGKVNLEGISLRGMHNVLNIMASIAALKIFNVNDQLIESSLRNFNTLEHRIEYVGEVDGVKVYNDSKATNPDATIKALESFEREVTLILGGKDKEMDFSILLPVMDKKVLNLILIGETKLKILKTIKSYSKYVSGLPYNIYLCDNFNDAVEKGLAVTEKGKVLLLSPACASFDMFKDYKDRGKKFKNLVLNKLNEKNESK